ncbi:MAG: biotin/lipoyl-binding protein, partial [Azoarcus sp.]|nr:biotin/lipoyl-binding protein [Azoarcus sp.]
MTSKHPAGSNAAARARTHMEWMPMPAKVIWPVFTRLFSSPHPPEAWIIHCIDFIPSSPSLVSMPAVSLLLRLCAALLAVPLLAACGAREDAASAPRPALTVTAEQPAMETWPIQVAANGSVAAWQEAIIGADVQNLRLAELRVDVGDTVSAGQELAVFDDEPVKIDVAQAKAALAQARASVTQARDNAERARTLRGSGA